MYDTATIEKQMLHLDVLYLFFNCSLTILTIYFENISLFLTSCPCRQRTNGLYVLYLTIMLSDTWMRVNSFLF